MDDLITRNQDAFQFCQAVINNLETHSINNAELFNNGIAGVFATSTPDSMGEIIGVEGLQEFVDSQQRRPMFVNTMHDTSKPPIGRVLTCKVFRDADSGSHFVAGVIGLYSPEHYGSCSGEIGIECNFPVSNEMPRSVRVLFDDFDLQGGAVVSFEEAPQWVDRNSRRLINKGIDTVQVVMISCGTVIASSFAGGFFSESGKDFFRWLKQEVLSKLRTTEQKRILGLTWKIKGVAVEAHIDVRQYSDIEFAWQKLQPHLGSIEAAIEKNRDMQPMRVVLSFDHLTLTWGIAFVVGETGKILTSKAVEKVDLDKMKGLSIGATTMRDLPPK